MTTIEELAQTIQTTHGIDSHDAALDVVKVHVDQIAGDISLYNGFGELTDDGAALLTDVIAHSYAHGFVSTKAENLLALIDVEAAAVEVAKSEMAERVMRRNELIRAALRTELPRSVIAETARIKEARLYQIRDNRR